MRLHSSFPEGPREHVDTRSQVGVKVLFLGAGASMAAGYPSGSQLLEAVEAYFATEMTDVGSKEAWNRFVAWRLASTEDQSLRLIVGSKNPEVLISYMDLVEQASRSEHSRLEAALRNRIDNLKRTDDPVVYQQTFEQAVTEQNDGYRNPVLTTASIVRRARRDLLLSIDDFLEYLHFRDRERWPQGPAHLRALFEPLSVPDTVITTNYDSLCERTLFALGMWSPRDGYGFDVSLVGQRVREAEGLRRALPTLPKELVAPSAIKVLKLHGSYGWIWREPVAGPAVTGDEEFRMEPRIHLSNGLLAALLPHDGPLAVPLYDRREPTGVYPGDPTLTLPTFMKQVSGPELQSIWAQAAKALEQADEIRIVGASLPESDLGVRTLFNPMRLRLAERAVRVVVQDPDSGAIARWRDLLGNDVEWDPGLAE